jgi:undecaprenyl diphosphate synthase
MSFLSDLDLERLPQHVAIVMDGNGRWARQRGLPRTSGHEAGEEALYDVVLGALDIGLRHLTVYAFSTENWKRPASEVRFLLNFNRTLLRKRRDELHDREVRVRFLGRREDWRIPKTVLRDMEEAEQLTKHNSKMTLTIAFNYGGQTEIVDAVKRLVADHDAGKLKGRRVGAESISSRLYHPEMPDPDLLIRTGGEMRISNFLVWQAAYAELWFTPVYWPDFDRENLYEAIRDYQKRSRRFGAIAENDSD